MIFSYGRALVVYCWYYMFLYTRHNTHLQLYHHIIHFNPVKLCGKLFDSFITLSADAFYNRLHLCVPSTSTV